MPLRALPPQGSASAVSPPARLNIVIYFNVFFNSKHTFLKFFFLPHLNFAINEFL